MSLLCKLLSHAWNKWEFIDDKCEKIRRCILCKKIEIESIPHDWSESEFIDHKECKQVRHCKRCSEVEIFIHEAGNLVCDYPDDNPKLSTLYCKHCGEVLHTYIEYHCPSCGTLLSYSGICKDCQHNIEQMYSR